MDYEKFLKCVVDRMDVKGHQYNNQDHDAFMIQGVLNNMTKQGLIKVLMSKHIAKLMDVKIAIPEDEFIDRAIDVVVYLIRWAESYDDADFVDDSTDTEAYERCCALCRHCKYDPYSGEEFCELAENKDVRWIADSNTSICDKYKEKE